MDTATLFIELFLSVLGLSYFTYGRKQEHAVALLTGVLLMVFPYFVSNLWLLIGIGVVLCATPFLIEF